MIKGFEKETAELTAYESSVLLPIFVRCLSQRVGKASAVTNKHIVERLRNSGYAIVDSRVRKIVNYIRTNGLVPCLIATSTGYYIAENEAEVIDYEDSLLGRENEIRRVRLSIQQQRKSKYNHQQLSLFNE